MPHSRRLTPEDPEDAREEHESSRNPTAGGNNGEPGHMGAANRRDENSISFRHFLQPQSDVVPTRSRNSRGTSSASVDLVDGAAMALPDFVQDHLGAEASASGPSPASSSSVLQGAVSSQHGATGACPLDLSSNPPADFSTSQVSNSYIQKKSRRHHESSVLNHQGASCSQAASAALPDFLSDGPMQCSGSGVDPTSLSSSSSSFASSSGGPSGGGASSSRSSAAGRSGESVSQEVERLRRELAEKNRRISQLESELSRQRSESSMFETAYLNAEQKLQAAARRALADESRITDLTTELQFLKSQFSEKLSLKSRDTTNVPKASNSSTSSSSNGYSNPGLSSNRVMEIAFTAEYLAGELMQQLQSLKREALKPDGREEHSATNSKGKGRKKSEDGQNSSH